MADPSNRIISHMNKDHHLALVDYVVVYGNQQLSSINAESVHMTKVTAEDVVLEYKTVSGQNKTLALNWDDLEDGEGLRVKSMSDIKAKLVAMAKYSAAKQGFSHKQITQILPPTSAASMSAYLFAILSVGTFINKDFLRTALGHVISINSPAIKVSLRLFDKWFPSFAVAIYAIHFLEVIFIAWPAAVKYRMPLPTKLAWSGFTFMEGYFHKARFNTLT